jgi:hypothetical protein
MQTIPKAFCPFWAGRPAWPLPESAIFPCPFSRRRRYGMRRETRCVVVSFPKVRPSFIPLVSFPRPSFIPLTDLAQ